VAAGPARWLGRLGLLESRCPACGKLQEGPVRPCPDCARRLAPRTGGYCPGCGAQAGDPGLPPMLCGDCRREPRPWDLLHCFGPYQGLLRDLILRYKFQRSLGLGRLLQTLALEAFRPGQERPELVVPVPLHPRRLLWRGYNQSLELARRLARESGIPLASQAMRRVRRTTPQARLSGPMRRENIRGAFVADPALVSGRRVLLVDDVLTTGATLEEGTLSLRRAGAVRVEILVLARTPEW